MVGGGLIKVHGCTFFVSLVGVCLINQFSLTCVDLAPYSFVLLVFENGGPSVPRCYLLFVFE